MTRDDCKCFEITGKRDMHSEECVIRSKPATMTGVYRVEKVRSGSCRYLVAGPTIKHYFTYKIEAQSQADELNAARLAGSAEERGRIKKLINAYDFERGYEQRDLIDKIEQSAPAGDGREGA